MQEMYAVGPWRWECPVCHKTIEDYDQQVVISAMETHLRQHYLPNQGD